MWIRKSSASVARQTAIHSTRTPSSSSSSSTFFKKSAPRTGNGPLSALASGRACSATTVLGATASTSAHHDGLNDPSRRRHFSSFNLFTPSDEHANLRNMVRDWVSHNVEPQALEWNRNEKFNHELWKRLGSELGMLGPMVSEEYGGAGFDAVAGCIIHEVQRRVSVLEGGTASFSTCVDVGVVLT